MSVANVQAPLAGEFNTDNLVIQAGRRVYPDPLGSMRPMGLLYTITAPAPNITGTSEQVLGTYSLPAYSLDAAGRKLLIRASWATEANGDTKTCKLYFGGTSLSSGSITTSSAFCTLTLVVTQRVSADSASPNSQLIVGWGFGGATGLIPVQTAAAITETVSGVIVIKATGQTGTALSPADVTLFDFNVQYMN